MHLFNMINQHFLPPPYEKGKTGVRKRKQSEKKSQAIGLFLDLLDLYVLLKCQIFI